MESKTGVSAHAGVRDRDLIRVIQASGPFLTIWSATPGAVEDPADRLAIRWHSARSTAAESGAPEALLDAAEPFFTDAHQRGDGIVLVASAGDQLVLAETLDEPPPTDRVSWSPLPALAPVIKQRQSERAYVLVHADRTGADIVSVSRDGSVSDVEVDETHGRPVSKTRGDGWSHRRNQQRTENTWARNARAVASEVDAAVARADASIVVAAGDERALSLLDDDVSDEVREKLRIVPGGRSADGSEDAFAADVKTLIRSDVAAEATDLLRRYDEERAKHAARTADLEGVFTALSSAQVDVLLVHDDPDDDATAWFDPSGFTAAGDPAVLEDVGAEPVEGRLADVAIRSALLSGAAVHVAPASALPSGRVGALLRWT